MNDLALLTRDGAVATLTLNRPDARNALSVDLLAALHAALDAMARDATPPTVLVLTGSGRSFCAGMDLKAVLGDNAMALKLLTSLADFTLRLRALGCVTLAKVNGAAIGGGCGLATVCDLAVTHADSKMGFPEVDLGVCPAVVAPWLVRKVGAGRARAILLRGGLMSGQQALECGIVNECVATREELDAAAAAIAARLALGGPKAILATKGLLNELDGSEDVTVVRRGAELSARVLATPEAQAALKAKLGA